MPDPDLGVEFDKDVVALTGDVFWAVRIAPDEGLESISGDAGMVG